MASVMIICGGLVRPKSENVKKPLVLLLFFEGSRCHMSFSPVFGDLGEIHGYVRGEDIGGVQRIIIYKKTKEEQKCGTIHLPNTPWGPEVPVRIYLSIYLSIYLLTFHRSP